MPHLQPIRARRRTGLFVEKLEPRLLLTVGPVSYWSFDDLPSVTDSVGRNDGTLMNGASWTDGIIGKALSLDGDDDYAIVSEASLPEEDMTLMFWMKSSDTSKHGTPVSYATSGEDNEFTIFNYQDFDLYRQGETTGQTGESGIDDQWNQWHHIAVTWNHERADCLESPGKGTFELFKDGERKFSSKCLPGVLLHQGGSLVFGQEQDWINDALVHDPRQAFQGLIDEIALYDRVLSALEISQAYWDVMLAYRLVSYWSFDDVPDGTAGDSVGTNDGILMGGASWTCGISGPALSLDGDDDYVSVSEASLPEEDMTVMFWMKSSDTSKYGTPVSYATSGEDNEFTIFDYRDFDLYRQGERTEPTGVRGTDDDDEWHHIAVTWEHRSSDCLEGEGEFEVFKDGERVSFSPSSTACLPGSALNQKGSLVFGQEQDSISDPPDHDPDQAFEGLIDEMAVYDRVLSAEEIRQAYWDLAHLLEFVTATPAYFPGREETNPFHYGNHDVFVHDGFAYIASKANWSAAKTSLDIVNVTDPANPSLAARVTTYDHAYDENTPDILYGINEIVVKRGTGTHTDKTFAYVVADAFTHSGAFSIWEISDTGTATLVDYIKSEDLQLSPEGKVTNALFGAHGISVQGDYAYVVSMGKYNANAELSSLCVFNVSDPYDQEPGGDHDVGILETQIVRHQEEPRIPKHPVDIAVDGERAYIIGYTGWDDGEPKLTVVDISNPATPTVLNSIKEGDSNGYYLGHAHRIEKLGDYVYIVSRDTTPALTIFDVSNVDENNPPVHTGAITGAAAPNYLKGASGLAVTSRYAFVASLLDQDWNPPPESNNGALSVFDISNPADPTLVEVWQGGGSPYYLEDAYNVFVDGDYVYVSANSENETEDGPYSSLGGGLSIFRANIPGSLNEGPPSVAVDLQPDSDSGDSATDNLTSDNTPTYEVRINYPGTISIDYDGDGAPEQTQSALCPGTYSFTPEIPLADDTFAVEATFVTTEPGTASDRDPTTIDTQAPVVTVDPLTTTDHSPALGGTVDDPEAVVKVVVNQGIYRATNDGEGEWILADDSITPELGHGVYEVVVTATDVAGNVGRDGTIDELLVVPAYVAGRHVFYNNSTFDGDDPTAGAGDDDAVAPDKEALLLDETAAFANYTSYSRGINGIMVDIVGLANPDDLNVENLGHYFEFHAGNSDDPAGWGLAPAPSSVAVRESPDIQNAQRVTFVWPDYAIRNQWLQVTVLADAGYTGLTDPHVFYFGNAVGESGNSELDAEVNDTDVLSARDNPHNFFNPATVTCAYDYNRDGRVNATDMLIARSNPTDQSTALKLIHAQLAAGESPGAKYQGEGTPMPTSFEQDPALPATKPDARLGKWTWLYEYDQILMQTRLPQKHNPAAEAVDKLLATYRL